MRNTVEYLRVDTHQLLSGRLETVKRPCLDKVLYRALVDVKVLRPLHKVFQILIFSVFLPLLGNCVYHRSSDAFDRIQRIPYRTV